MLLTRRDPFALSIEPFSDLFGTLGPMDPFRTANRATLPMEVWEGEKEFHVAVEIPGAKKEHISVSVDGSLLTVEAELKPWKGPQEDQLVARHSDRLTGKITRTIDLGFPVERDNAQAKYVDGVLMLTLPKAEAAMPKRLEIH